MLELKLVQYHINKVFFFYFMVCNGLCIYLMMRIVNIHVESINFSQDLNQKYTIDYAILNDLHDLTASNWFIFSPVLFNECMNKIKWCGAKKDMMRNGIPLLPLATKCNVKMVFSIIYLAVKKCIFEAKKKSTISLINLFCMQDKTSWLEIYEHFSLGVFKIICPLQHIIGCGFILW